MPNSNPCRCHCVANARCCAKAGAYRATLTWETKNGSHQLSTTAIPKPTDQELESSNTFMVGPWILHEATPLSRAEADEYIWLVPITS
jgi:hypothetical protein